MRLRVRSFENLNFLQEFPKMLRKHWIKILLLFLHELNRSFIPHSSGAPRKIKPAMIKVIRKRKGLDLVSLEAETEPREGYDTIPHPEFIADWSQSPAALAQQNETQRLLDAALDQLDEKHRLVFVLRDVEGLSVRETAEALAITEANVKVRLLRARLQLREQLTRAFGDAARQVSRNHRHAL